MTDKKNRMIKSLPNCVTFMRILGTIGMFFTKTFTNRFFILYTLCGISDVVDGWLARTMKVTSDFGAKLDSIADLLFYATMLIKIFPAMWEILPKGIWIAVGSIVVLRIISYSLAAIKFKRFASLHTYLNKATGFFIFGIPYLLTRTCGILYCKWTCLVAGISTLEELVIHICSKTYEPNHKSITNL